MNVELGSDVGYEHTSLDEEERARLERRLHRLVGFRLANVEHITDRELKNAVHDFQEANNRRGKAS
jgi:hypothetical protein